MRRAADPLLLGLLWVASAAAAAAAQREAPSPVVAAFDEFMGASKPVCEHEPARHCVDLAWRFADANGDGGLSLAEFQRVRDALAEWTAWKGESLDREKQASITLGLLLVDGVGLETLIESYDTDGDGLVSRSELLADVRLDERPLGRILEDSEALDRKAFAGRFGPIAPLVDGLLR